jgi:hypothetical protein
MKKSLSMKKQTRVTFYVVTLMASFLVANVARANGSSVVQIGLDDARSLASGAEDPVVYAVGTSPYGFDLTSLNIQSGPNFPEAFDLHGEYMSASPLASGQSLSVNFNFIDPSPQGWVGDTLNIVFTGHTPTAGDLNNISVDLHFRSDSETAPLPGLVNAISINEVPGFIPLAPYIIQSGGPSDIQISVQSDAESTVPDTTSTLGMLFLATALLFGAERVRAARAL